MAIAYVPGRFKYILKADREEMKKAAEEKRKFKPTVFFLKALSARELEDLEGSMSIGVTVNTKTKKISEQSASQEVKPGEKVNAFLRMGLMGWEDFFDIDGKEIKFKKEESTGQASWDAITNVVPYRYELYNALEDGNTVTEEEGKNS